jgi:lipopolysaccharide export system permease protein
LTRFSPTLSAYIGAQFLLAFGVLLAGFAGLIVLFDVVELMRRTVGVDGMGLSTLVGMALLKLPHTAQATLPFVVMVAMMFALFRLSRSHELVVIRSAGMSVWQFLAPPIVLAGLIGAFNLAAVDPLSAGMYDTYQRMEDELIRRRATTLEISTSGLWLRESDGTNATIVHAIDVRQDEGILFVGDITIFRTGEKQVLLQRIEAKRGQLLDGFFKLDDALDLAPNRAAEHHAEYFLPTSLTLGQVQDSFAAPETMSFWALPEFIRVSQASGFSALPHRLYWQSLLASPFLLCAMVLVAAAFYLTAHARLGGWTARGIAGVATGFVFYFFTKFTYALGQSATLPLALAAWAPTAVAAMLGLAYLFHREDG